MSVYSEYSRNPCAETWRAIEDEVKQDEYNDSHITRCGECPHFTASEFDENSPHYEVGICEEWAHNLHQNGEGMGEAIITYDTRPCPCYEDGWLVWH